MRNVVAGLFISLDGVTEAPYKWQFEFDEDMAEAMTAQMAAQDAMLLGRVTYQEWASYWPNTTEDADFASFINNIPKYVVSTTLDSAEWQNSTLINGDLAGAIANLKQQPGKLIGVQGSPTLVRSLLQDDLLDELQLWIHPVVAGSGKRLFTDGCNLKRLRLVNAKATSSGVVIATYQPLRGE